MVLIKEMVDNNEKEFVRKDNDNNEPQENANLREIMSYFFDRCEQVIERQDILLQQLTVMLNSIIAAGICQPQMSTRAIKQIGVFKGGINESFIRWQDNFEDVVKTHMVTDKQKCLLFSTAMRDGAKEYLYTLSDEERIDWIILKQIFNEKYNSVKQQDHMETRFLYRVQLPNETVDRYATILQKLGKAAYGPKEFIHKENLIMLTFIRGLLPEIRGYLVGQTNTLANLEEAIMRASEIEQEIQQGKCYKKPVFMQSNGSRRQPQEVRQVIESVCAEEDPIFLASTRVDNREGERGNVGVNNYTCLACKRPGHTVKYCRVICYNCNQKGHMKHNCPMLSVTRVNSVRVPPEFNDARSYYEQQEMRSQSKGNVNMRGRGNSSYNPGQNSRSPNGNFRGGYEGNNYNRNTNSNRGSNNFGNNRYVPDRDRRKEQRGIIKVFNDPTDKNPEVNVVDNDIFYKSQDLAEEWESILSP